MWNSLIYTGKDTDLNTVGQVVTLLAVELAMGTKVVLKLLDILIKSRTDVCGQEQKRHASKILLA